MIIAALFFLSERSNLFFQISQFLRTEQSKVLKFLRVEHYRGYWNFPQTLHRFVGSRYAISAALEEQEANSAK